MKGRIKLYKPISRFLYPPRANPYHLSRLPTPCTFWLNQKTNEQLASERYRSYNVRGISTQEVYQAAQLLAALVGSYSTFSPFPRNKFMVVSLSAALSVNAAFLQHCLLLTRSMALCVVRTFLPICIRR